MSFTDELLARSPLSKTDDIERDIGDLIQISHPALPSIHIVPNDDHPLPKGPMPDYVEHKEGVNQVGKLSAEAVVREYDAAVKEIEALGADIRSSHGLRSSQEKNRRDHHRRLMFRPLP